MIETYHRPQTLEEALVLLSRPNAVPLGGGTVLALSRPGSAPVEAVDLQALGLDRINLKGNDLEIGATCTLQALMEHPSCPEALKAALKIEAPLNVRNAATAAGTLFCADGRSPFASVLLALDAKINQAGGGSLGIGEFLPLRPRGLVLSISVPLNAKAAFEFTARTPGDKPVVSAALARWNSGRTRLAVGGWGACPSLAMDGTESEGLDPAARNACHEAADEWAGAAFRMDVAAVLAGRCLEQINA